MEFRTVVTSGREVLRVGAERGNTRSALDWLEPGRWKISMVALDSYVTEHLRDKSFGTSIERFVFCFEIADFELWAGFFQASSEYTSYRPKKRELWSVGQLRWSDVKDLAIIDQLRVLQDAVLTAVRRVGTRPRKPRDFDYNGFAAALELILSQAPVERLAATPAL